MASHPLYRPQPQNQDSSRAETPTAEGREKGKIEHRGWAGLWGQTTRGEQGAKAPSRSRDASRAAPRGFVPFCSVSFTVLKAHLAAVPWVQA